MKIKLVTPARANAQNGNFITAIRWGRIIKGLGHHLTVQQQYDGKTCDLLIALHALRSYDSIRRYREKHPKSPLIVVLTGTDLYRDIHRNSHAQQSLELANRLIVLQKKGFSELPPHLHRKTRVIYQSASRVNGTITKTNHAFQVCVIGHLREEKDPFRTALAARLLPASSQVRILQIGRALSKEMKERAQKEHVCNPRYHWLGELPHWKTRRVLAESHVLSLTSRMEGSSNVLSEAIASSVPVIASRIAGLMGTLGEGYPGYFPVGNTRALTRLLRKVESNPKFYLDLKTRCTRLFSLVNPEQELGSWKKLLRELSK